MTTRKAVLVLGAFAISLWMTASAAVAQSQLDELKKTTPEQRAAAQTEMMKAKLALTPDQTPKIAALNLKYAKESDPIIKSPEGPFRKFREIREINNRKEAELKQLLSPDQFQKYLAAKSEMREEFEQKMEKK
jgi:hypothetical protein